MSENKNKRQNVILDLIKNDIVNTQEELCAKLISLGFKTTQATISRDIKKLKLTKTSNGINGYKYILPNENISMDEKMKKLFKESVVSVLSSNNIIVIKTLAGSANTAALFIDSLKHKEILGSVAGDDTIILVIDEIENVSFLVKLLKSFL